MPSRLAAPIIALGLWLPQAGPARTQSPSPAAAHGEGLAEDPAVTLLVRKIYTQMRSGKVDDDLLTDGMKKELSPDVLAQNKPIFDQLGDPTRVVLQTRTAAADGTTCVYLAVFATAQLHVTIFVTTAGKVGGYTLAL